MERGRDTSARTGRRYDSPRRREQALRTRERILAAAREAFLTSGYAATTVRSVASAAAVSLPTVEQGFGTKAQLLKEVIDVAIAGDDEPIAVLDRAPIARAAAQRRGGARAHPPPPGPAAGPRRPAPPGPGPAPT